MGSATPATVLLDQHQISYTLHPYTRADSTADGQSSYGLEAARALGIEPTIMFKTLIASVDGALVCAVVPVAGRLDTKALAAAAGGKNAELADPQRAQRATGYVIGGISPLGQRTKMAVYVDESALTLPAMFVSAGRRGLQLQLAPADLIRLIDARTAPLSTG